MTRVYKVIENSLYERLMNKAEKTDKEAEMNANVIESIPTSIRSKATRLLTYLKQAKAIDWNEKGEIIYKNNPVTGSQIVDLISLATKTLGSKKDSSIIGIPEFIDILKSANTPKELISNHFLESSESRAPLTTQKVLKKGMNVNDMWSSFEKFENDLLKSKKWKKR